MKKRSLKKMQDGGKTPRQSIVVTDPNDPRLRAFNDSNNLYNAYLRPKNYHPEEVEQARQAQAKTGKRAFAKGGVIKRSLNKYADGGNLVGYAQLGSMAGNAILGAIPDKQLRDANGNVLGSYETQGEAIGKGALSGAAAGAGLGLVGMGVGAAIGGTMGFINQRKDAKQLAETQSNINQNISSQKRLGGFNNNFNTMQTTNDNMYAHGGIVDTDQPGAIAELELNEQMQLPDGTVMGVDGPSHEEGGVEVNVPEGTRVFSDRLKLGNKTFAKHAKTLNTKIAKLDKKLDSTAKQNTEMLINKQLDGLFNTQEEMKAVKEQTKQRKLFAKGGTIPAEHNSMYPAHNVTIMRHGGLTHYSGLDGDPSVVQNGSFANFRENALYKKAFNANKNYSFDLNSPAANNNYLGKTSNPAVTENSNLPASFWGNSFAKGAQSVYGDMGKAMLKGDMTETTVSPEVKGFNVSPQNMAFAAAGLTNMIQNQQINKVNRPRTINNVAFTPGNRPAYVNYSNERAAIDSEAAGAREGIRLGSGSYSTQAANLQKVRNQQMMGKGRSFQTQENANRTLDNSYNAQQAAAYNQGVQANLGIDQYNLENQYNFDLWKQGNKLKATGAMGDTATNLFNNQTSYQNQMDYWNVIKNSFSGNVGKDTAAGSTLANKKNGGIIKKRSFKK